MLRILYLTALESPDTGVIENQVYNLMSEVASQDQNLEIHLLSLLPMNSYVRPGASVGYFVESQRRRNAKIRSLKKKGVKLTFFPLLVDGRNFYMKAHELLFFAAQAFWILLYHVCKCRIELIHARSYPSAFLALCIKKVVGIEYVLDPRGIYPEEGIVNHKLSPGSISYKMWKRLEECMLREAISVVACSASLANHVKSICKEANVNVIRNCVDTTLFHYNRERRFHMRKEHNLDSRFVSVFSGGLGTWTNVRKLVQFFVEIRKVKKDAALLILTGDNRCTPDMFIPYGVDASSIKVFHLEPEEVPRYLVMGDVGLIVRNKDVVNRVAFPTKFAEYLSCGLPVLSDSNVMDVVDLIREYRCGATVETVDEKGIREELPVLLREYSEFQNNGFELVKNHLDMSKCAEKYRELYKKSHS